MGDQQRRQIYNPSNSKNKCLECKSSFSDLSNLRKHVRRLHPNKINELAPQLYKESSNFKFTCENCRKNFNHERNLRYHMKTHKDKRIDQHREIENNITKGFKKCPMCSYNSSFKKEMLIHFKDVHEITIQSKDIDFSSVEDFQQWKINMENDSNSKFVNKGTHSFITYYICHRSGSYVPSGIGKRHLKTQGTNKINAYCPASINLIEDIHGKCKVNLIETHVGHQTDIGHLYFTSAERHKLALQIASKVPFDAILDEIRDSISDSTLKRIHLLTRKDLYNIESCFNLSSSSVRHRNDAISVESWVNEMKRDGECVLFYKPQGIVLEDRPELKAEDFVLIIMTPAQCEFLKKYGSDCICLDGTHGLNSYNFELNTLLVLDDLREGFPCAFLISNRSDKHVLGLFFSQVKLQTGSINPKIFMSDLADSFFNAWLEVMGTPEKRLFCTWHVDRAWRKNLTKIKSKEKQVTVYKQLRTLLEERDFTVFEKMIGCFCNMTDDPETIDFVKYFVDYYLNNYQNWAYCFRLHAGINTNMHLERMHKTIKYIYLKGKNVKRLDKAIAAIMRFVRDKLIDRLVVVNKGKISSKLKDIRSRHKNMQDLDPSLIIQVEHGWKVSSKSNHEMYFLQEIKENCTCHLICTDCKICIHRYCCSCLDSSIKFNMCKHIHLLAKFIKNNEPPNEEQSPNVVGAETEDDDNNLYIHYDQTVDESEAIVTQLSKKKSKISLKEEKDIIKTRLLKHLDNIKSPTKLAIFKNVVAPLTPTLAAAENIKQKTFPSSSKVTPHNETIPVQRRLWKTKKENKKRENKIKKSNEQESLNIAISLLQGSQH